MDEKMFQTLSRRYCSISVVLAMMGNPLGVAQMDPASLNAAIQDLLDIQKDLNVLMTREIEILE